MDASAILILPMCYDWPLLFLNNRNDELLVATNSGSDSFGCRP